ncbi:MAG: nucleotidyltransferase family protein [Promethearchaeia archaeon]
MYFLDIKPINTARVGEFFLMSRTIEEIKPVIERILKSHNVKRASVFGSFARGEATAQSDLDLIVEFSGRKSLLDLARLKSEIEKKLQCGVDILTFNSIHPLLKERILKQQVGIL